MKKFLFVCLFSTSLISLGYASDDEENSTINAKISLMKERDKTFEKSLERAKEQQLAFERKIENGKPLKISDVKLMQRQSKMRLKLARKHTRDAKAVKTDLDLQKQKLDEEYAKTTRTLNEEQVKLEEEAKYLQQRQAFFAFLAKAVLTEYYAIDELLAESASELARKEAEFAIEEARKLSQQKKEQQKQNQVPPKIKETSEDDEDSGPPTGSRSQIIATLKKSKNLIILLFQEPAPHHQVTFDDFSKLMKKIKGIIEQYSGKVTNKAKGSHYHPRVQTPLDILGHVIQLTDSLAATVVKRHGNNDRTLSSDEVKAVRDRILIPLKVTPKLFEALP